MQSSFLTLRPWDGSQARAFEELSYQLLKADAPDGSQVIRTGNPDGGVEWYAQLTDGTEWGWQAKHVHGIDPLLTAMAESVKRVVLERPQLVKLIFVISWNLATSTRGRTRTSQRQKYEAKVAAWKESIDGAARIDFELVQESDLLDRLAQPRHRGRAWFWWADPQLSESWFRDRLREQADVAGERYRPDLQVDLPIEEDLKALGFSASIFEEFEQLRRTIISSGREIRLTPSGPAKLRKLHRAALKSAKALVDACSRTVLQIYWRIFRHSGERGSMTWLICMGTPTVATSARLGGLLTPVITNMLTSHRSSSPVVPGSWSRQRKPIVGRAVCSTVR